MQHHILVFWKFKPQYNHEETSDKPNFEGHSTKLLTSTFDPESVKVIKDENGALSQIGGD